MTGFIVTGLFVCVCVTQTFSWEIRNKGAKKTGEAFLLTVGAFLLTVKLLCLQSLKALIRRTFPL